MASPIGAVESLRVRRAALRTTSATGELLFPAIPGLVEECVGDLGTLFERLERPFSPEALDEFREALLKHTVAAFRDSPRSSIRVRYETDPADPFGIIWTISAVVPEPEDEYRTFVERAELPLLGEDALRRLARGGGGRADPDAPHSKLDDLILELGSAKNVRCLDAGAGSGRSAIALARIGYAIDAVEPVDCLAAALVQAIESEGVVVEVLCGDFGDPGFALPSPRYELVLASGLGPRFRGLTPIRRLLRRLGEVLEPGGLGVVDVFLAEADFEPAALERSLAEARFCPVYTRAQLELAADGAPLDLVLDEDDFEHLDVEPALFASASGQLVFHDSHDSHDSRNSHDAPPETALSKRHRLVYRHR